MKKTLACLRKADEDWGLIEPGDSIAIGLSGGKDSLLLLHALNLYRLFSKKDFALYAITLDMGFDGFDTDSITGYCDKEGVPHHIRKTDLGSVIFEQRKEKSPCALCSKFRRGILCEMARDLGCNKLALAHNREDVLETLLMNVLYHGKLKTYKPKTYMSRSDVTVIRPVLYLPESHIVMLAKKLELPVSKNPCLVDGKTSRQNVKEVMLMIEDRYPGGKDKLLSALKSEYSLW